MHVGWYYVPGYLNTTWATSAGAWIGGGGGGGGGIGTVFVHSCTCMKVGLKFILVLIHKPRHKLVSLYIQFLWGLVWLGLVWTGRGGDEWDNNSFSLERFMFWGLGRNVLTAVQEGYVWYVPWYLNTRRVKVNWLHRFMYILWKCSSLNGGGGTVFVHSCTCVNMYWNFSLFLV